MENWKTPGPILEEMRREDIRRAETMRSVEALSGFLEMSLKACPPKPTSGLVERQALFAGMRR